MGFSTLVHADLSDEIPIVNNLQTPEALAAASLGQNLIGTIFAYWPHRHTHPSPRIVRLTGEDGLTHNYIAVFKDPADNAYDLSNEEEVYAALKEEDMISKAERISGLNAAFEHSRKHEQLMAELDAKVEAEEAAQGGIKEKRGKWAQSHQE
ncbi:hypothetical protein BGX28_000930 [Mortierella sp. GBA30]|nr:hypothetical protein BGX28_000930 [Mortierella sp. GBA30]